MCVCGRECMHLRMFSHMHFYPLLLLLSSLPPGADREDEGEGISHTVRGELAGQNGGGQSASGAQGHHARVGAER